MNASTTQNPVIADQEDPSSPPVRLTMVCTANLYRSPVAAAVAEAWAEARGAPLRVWSMGLLPGGERCPPQTIRVAADYGIDLADHVSRSLDDGILGSADLILTMTQAQARELVARNGELWPRVFTLKRFAAFVESHVVPKRAGFADWLAYQVHDRAKTDLFGDSAQTDVADPKHEPEEVWRAIILEITRLVQQCLDRCLPLLTANALHGRS